MLIPMNDFFSVGPDVPADFVQYGILKQQYLKSPYLNLVGKHEIPCHKFDPSDENQEDHADTQGPSTNFNAKVKEELGITK